MHKIKTSEMSDEFLICWEAACAHLNKQVDGGLKSWLRAHPYPPFLEHISFRLGNQLFFIRVEDADGNLNGPGNSRGHITAAGLANGRACIMPMKKKFFGGGWVPAKPGWGLLDAESKKLVDPVALVTNEEIEMTSWEVHDFAVQVVRDHLAEKGFELMSWQGNPDVDPSIWFVGKTGRPEWVVVRPTKFPAKSAARPAMWNAIAEACSKLSTNGHFASVALASADQQFASPGEPPVSLLRGRGIVVRFAGLE